VKISNKKLKCVATQLYILVAVAAAKPVNMKTLILTLVATALLVCILHNHKVKVLQLKGKPHIVMSVLDSLKLSKQNPYCMESDDAAERYDKLSKALNALSEKRTILISVNLYNNNDIASNFIVQLWELVSYFGRENVFVSVYENGSNDETKIFLGLLNVLLKHVKVEHEIILGNETKPAHVHRIEYLSRVRNRAIAPLKQLGQQIFRVIFMNDIIFCADDVKELLYQSLLQKADITCGLDYDTTNDTLGFYDTWVARDVRGRLFDKEPLDNFTHHIMSNYMLQRGTPFQVGCCWNGAAVMNPAPFLSPHSIEFKRRISKDLPPSHPMRNYLMSKFKGVKLYDECSSSEINTLCKDFQNAGFSKVIIVPRVRVAYDWLTYHTLRGKLYPFNATFSYEESTIISYKSLANSTVCLPLDADDLRGPDGEQGEETLFRV
jgi:Cryptococcal mannosyltransferase 1